LKKAHLARPLSHGLRFAENRARSKYYGNWCGNRLAVTIYVTTNKLRFSPLKAVFVRMPVYGMVLLRG
jgi:hypothetical protein